MYGHLYDGSFSVKEGRVKGLDHLKKCYSDSQPHSDLRQYFEDLAYHIQTDLEDVVTTFIDQLHLMTGEENLVFAGGVALNSTVNGVLHSKGSFRNVYVPPYPGDEGICIGCATFALSHLSSFQTSQPQSLIPALPKVTMPYFGKLYSDLDIRSAIAMYEPWIIWDEGDEVEETVRALVDQKVVGWFQGRGEFGPRALGNRSLLASPRHRHMTDHLNKVIKKREPFRPFAPSVLAECSEEWFSNSGGNVSPFMSMTQLSPRAPEIQATTHVDATARFQTITKDQNPTYHRLISRFREVDGIPMILNTSFNVAGEPVVESPWDALNTFFATDGLSMLAFPGLVVKKRILTSLSKEHVISSSCSSFRSHQVQDSAGSSVRTSVTYIPLSFGEHTADQFPEDIVDEKCVELLDSFELELLEFVHAQDAISISRVYEEMLDGEEVDEKEESSQPSTMDIQIRLLHLYHKRLIFTPLPQKNMSRKQSAADVDADNSASQNGARPHTQKSETTNVS